ncbi:hypothetical protein [Flavobacterium saccharophilum]|uniref:Uncharacterized protein n=1 Tax=Flavobacterium saccharophilum TaxID=29534 RepID=A0A1M7M002_9FLAO|nr:hypothetical protein [Flavobacterium saccharophilum]SHM83999.1 hypothetical protein SAMN05444366_4278 [Flavobacterium saccharophilum]
MNELELLNLLITIEHNLQSAKMDVQYANDTESKQIAYQTQKEIEHKIDLVTTDLIDIADKSQSEETKYSVINQLNHYVEQINLARPGARLTRNQGMMLENMLFGNISMDINNIISHGARGAHIPAYLEYTLSEKNSISIPELSTFLNNEILIIRSIENVNFIKLRDYYNQFRIRVQSQFMNE